MGRCLGPVAAGGQEGLRIRARRSEEANQGRRSRRRCGQIGQRMSTDILRGASLDSMTVTLWLRRLYTFKPRTNHDNTYVEEVETQLSQNVIIEIMTRAPQIRLISITLAVEIVLAQHVPA